LKAAALYPALINQGAAPWKPARYLLCLYFSYWPLAEEKSHGKKYGISMQLVTNGLESRCIAIRIALATWPDRAARAPTAEVQKRAASCMIRASILDVSDRTRPSGRREGAQMFMSEKEAIKIVEDTLLGEDSIPGKLAMKKGIDAAAVVKLEEAMSYLTKAFENRDYVPKKVAAAFVDLTADFERTMALYPDEDQRRIEDLKLHIIELGTDLFGWD
jgi:hypothetical protein